MDKQERQERLSSSFGLVCGCDAGGSGGLVGICHWWSAVQVPHLISLAKTSPTIINLKATACHFNDTCMYLSSKPLRCFLTCTLGCSPSR